MRHAEFWHRTQRIASQPGRNQYDFPITLPTRIRPDIRDRPFRWSTDWLFTNGDCCWEPGVEISGINRIASRTLEAAIVEGQSNLGASNSALIIAQRIESVLSPSSGSIGDRLQNFFQNAQNLQARPGDPVERSLLIQSADALANEFNSVAENLDQIRTESVSEVEHVVGSLNQKLAALFETNRQISIAEAPRPPTQ